MKTLFWKHWNEKEGYVACCLQKDLLSLSSPKFPESRQPKVIMDVMLDCDEKEAKKVTDAAMDHYQLLQDSIASTGEKPTSAGLQMRCKCNSSLLAKFWQISLHFVKLTFIKSVKFHQISFEIIQFRKSSASCKIRQTLVESWQDLIKFGTSTLVNILSLSVIFNEHFTFVAVQTCINLGNLENYIFNAAN